MTATSSRCSTLKCVLNYSKPRKGSSLSPHPKSSPSAMSTAEPAVITQSGKCGNSPFPWHPAFLQQAGLRKDTKLQIPAGKKFSIIYMMNLHKTGSWVLVCLAGTVHYREFSMASLLGCGTGSEVPCAALLHPSIGVFFQW